MKNKFSIALSLAVILSMLLVSLALADDVSNNLDESVDAAAEVMSLNVGGSTGSTVLRIIEQNGDGKNGCNLQGPSKQLTVSITSSNTSVATVSPASITFSDCNDATDTSITVTPIGQGSANITLSLVSFTTNSSGVTSASFNLAPGAFAVNVAPPPNTAPLVSVTGVAHGSSYEFGSVPTAGCFVQDAEDGTPSVSPTLSDLSGPNAVYGLGTQIATCSYTDSGGLTTTVQATYEIVDTTKPVIDPHTNVTAEATSAGGAFVTYTSPATHDAVFGDGSATCSPASDSQFALGPTTVTCNATDGAGNAAIATTFKVIVVDTTPPTIDAHSDVGPIEATGPDGAVATYTSPATHDAVDGDGTATCTPASGSTFGLGQTTVTCNATDAAGNAATATTFKVTVVDTTPPTITFVSRLPAANGNGWNNSDVTVTWSCNDLVGVVSASVSKIVSTEGANQSAKGTCTDTSGNTTDDTVTGINIDKTPPSFVSGSVSPNPIVQNGTATATATWNGDISGIASQSCGSVNTSSIGSFSVNCTAADNAGNTANQNVSYSVIYAWHGFFQPIDNPNVVNKAKAGSAIPVKFSLGGYQGMTIFATGSPSSAVAACGSAPAEDAIETVLTSANSGLTYDATADQYVYVWKTDKLWSGCRTLTVKLADGTIHQAYFNFTK